eukprot:UN10365
MSSPFNLSINNKEVSICGAAFRWHSIITNVVFLAAILSLDIDKNRTFNRPMIPHRSCIIVSMDLRNDIKLIGLLVPEIEPIIKRFAVTTIVFGQL